MNNMINISTDGVCVYIDSKMQVSTISKIGVILLTLIAFIPLFFILTSFSSDNSKEIVFAVIAYLAIVGGITLRFASWKLFGEEFISVSTKSIKYQRSYGIIRTNPQTIKINELAIAFNETATNKNGVELGNILFYNYDQLEQGNLVFESTIYMSQKQFEKFDNQLSLIFYNKKVKNGEITELTMN